MFRTTLTIASAGIINEAFGISLTAAEHGSSLRSSIFSGNWIDYVNTGWDMRPESHEQFLSLVLQDLNTHKANSSKERRALEKQKDNITN